MKNIVWVAAIVLVGCAGSAGKSGDTGAAGPQGATGAQGPAGEQGAPGAQGATGSQGAAGANGVDGANGANGVIDVDLQDGGVAMVDGGTLVVQIAPVSCPDGQYVKAIDGAGNPTCAADQNTTYTSGQGLALTGNSFSVDFTQAQQRVSGACNPGSMVTSINGDGSVNCGPFTTTIYVPGNGSASANGAALVGALASITAASASSPFVVKLEPGVYDLGNTTLQLKSFVDLAGTTASTTTLTFSDGSIKGAASTTLRDLTLTGTFTAQTARFLNLNPGGAATNVVLNVSGGSNVQFLTAIVVGSSPVVLDNVQISMSGSQHLDGIDSIVGGGNLTLRRSSLALSGTAATTFPSGINVSGSLTIDSSTLSITNLQGTSQAAAGIGVAVSGTSFTMRDSVVSAGSGVGLTGSTNASILDSRIDGGISVSTAGTLELIGGRVSGSTSVVSSSSGAVHLMNTVLFGTTSGNISCNNVIEGLSSPAYTTHASDCPTSL